MLLLLLAHALAALAAPLLIRRLGSTAFALLALVPAAAAGWALSRAPAVLDGTPLRESVSWLPAYGLDLDFHVDPLAMVLTLLVTGVGALVLLYCAGYFAADDPSAGRFAAAFTAFAGAMLGLVLADNLILVYVFWELTTVFSYLLIGHFRERRAARRAALQALIVTTLGGLAMLVGLLILGHAAGTRRISGIVADPPPSSTAVSWALVLILIGALSKSAQLPFHFWLPGAMAAPTPVSAYLHAAAMVKAGVYLVALLAPAFAGYPPWRALVLGLGAATMLLGGWRALRQYDLKLLLAYGTVSQLGLLMVLLGTGSRTAAVAGLAMLVAHAAAKAALFMTVGIIDHATGTRDLRRLRGLRRQMPVVFWTAVGAIGSMIALPPTAGFVAKEAAYQGYLSADPGSPEQPWRLLLLIALVAGSALTFAYGLRFLWGGFRDGGADAGAGADAAGSADASPTTPARTPVLHTPGRALLIPPALLAALGLALGLTASYWNSPPAAYADAYPSGPHPYRLALWHGFGAALWLSLLSMAAGALLFAGRTWFFRLQAALAWPFTADGGYHRAMLGLDRAALAVTSGLQRGSLPGNLGVILLVLVLLPGGVLLLAGPWNIEAHRWDTPAQLAVALAVVAAALVLPAIRHRLSAVLLAGVTGYGTSLLFVLAGAPDLALTQFLVETVALVVFVLVLRRLPDRFERERRAPVKRTARVLIAAASGLLAGGMLLVAGGARKLPSISLPGMAEASVAGGGRDIVNVTLVDLRAWDTLGEISVLAACAAGVTSLVFLRRRSTTLPRERPGAAAVAASPSGAPPPWLRGVHRMAPERRSLIFEVLARLTFHTAIVLSLFTLFAGHNAPGGGFAGGLIAGLALTVRYLAGGRWELGEAVRLSAGSLIGAGLCTAAVAALTPLAFGGTVLQGAVVDLHVPLVGDVHLASALAFDLGVYLLVVGLVLDILRSLGSEIDRQKEAESGESAEEAVRV